MIIGLKKFFLPDSNETGAPKFEEIKENYEISQEELDAIEAVDLSLKKNKEEMDGYIDSKSKYQLSIIEKQCHLILKSDVNHVGEKISEDNQVKALLSLLRIYQINHPNSLGDQKINTSGDKGYLLKILGSESNSFFTIFGNNENALGIINKFKSEDDAQYIGDINKKGEEIIEINTPEIARTYLENAYKIEGEDVKMKFANLKKEYGNDEKFKKSITLLVKQCLDHVDGLDPLLKKFNIEDKNYFYDLQIDQNLYSDKIKKFQKIISNIEGIEDILNGGGIKGIDGKLGFNTIKAIVEISKISVLQGRTREKGINIDYKIDGRKDVENEGASIESSPLTLAGLFEYGLIDKSGKFVFFDNGGKSDFVKAIPGHPEQTYIEINNVRYFTTENCPDGALRILQTPVPREIVESGELKTVIDNKIQIGKFDSKGRFVGNEFVVTQDGNQENSSMSQEYKFRKGRKDEKFIEEAMETVYNSGEVKEVKKDGKKVKKISCDRYVGFKDSEGKSTDRLSRRQLDRMSGNDISSFLDQAIKAYKETSSKADDRGRFNLNRVIKKIVNDSSLLDNFGGFNRSHDISHSLLGLDTGFYSKPDKKLKNHSGGVDELVKKLKMTEEEIGKAKDLFDGKDLKEVSQNEETKGDRIRNNLSVLKLFVDLRSEKIDKWNTEGNNGPENENKADKKEIEDLENPE